MLKRPDRVASETLGALNRDSIADPIEVMSILQRAAECGSVLRAGTDRRQKSRTATIIHVTPTSMLLLVPNIDVHDQAYFFFNLDIEDVRYFFACAAISAGAEHRLLVTVPDRIYRAERRDLTRTMSPSRQIIVTGVSGNWSAVEVADETRDGLAIRLPEFLANDLPHEVKIRVDESSDDLFARVRHRTSDSGRAGWTKIGLSVSRVPTGDLISVDHRHRILGRNATAGETLRLAKAGFSALAHRAGFTPRWKHRVNLIQYANERGETIRAIEDSWGAPVEYTAVIIPPAWGRTKETLLPLALTLVETFRNSREPIRVLRFDGTNRRGESYIDPGCRRSGDEYLRFTFSQAARDLSATVDYLRRDSAGEPRQIIVVTFSLAAIEARHALATDNRVSGWISVVGMADLNAALKTISGGIDFGNGLLQGIRYGKHELVGVIADMDHTGLDAIRNGIGFLEDARRDMAKIEIPITWIHGKYDAWMDLDRVVEVMSCGRTDNRRLIEVPTGHQLRSGHKALETFQLIAEEVTEMALGDRKRAAIPRVSRIAAARSAELARIPKVQADIREFWADYLLGRSRVLGMELLAATPAYRDFLNAQVKMLRLEAGQRVGDLGSGNGEFAIGLRRGLCTSGVVVLEFDFVRDALLHARARRKVDDEHVEVTTWQCLSNLDLRRGVSIPLATQSLDAVLASLVISYVASPKRLLREIYRVIKPGGRAVISSMVQDADSMMLFHDGLIEYATSEARSFLGQAVDGAFNALIRDFLNDGSRLLDLEERGLFRFWEASELRYEVANAGFVEVEAQHEFGEPPQAVVVSARRP